MAEARGGRSITAVIVDDEPLAREALRELLAAYEDIRIVAECEDGVAAIETVGSLRPDCLFLDIQMPEVGGFEVLEQLGERIPPAVVFVTAYDEFALRAFEVHALDYVLKPIDPARLERAVDRVRQTVASASPFAADQRIADLLSSIAASGGYLERFLVRTGSKLVVVRAADAEWIEAQRDYVRLHCRDKRHMVRGTLQEVAARLDPSRFQRVHRSAIVNIDFLLEVHPLESGDHALVMQSGARVPLSRTYRDGFMAALQRHQ
ncbi:MAG: response regulator receiver [Bacteroidetes bacterium]|nr:response regulator receiver [Bacteroidota bacterium]